MPGDFENIAVAVSKAMQTHIHNTKQHFKVVHVNCARCQFFELKSTIRENLQDEMQRNLIKIGIITKSTKAPNEPFYQNSFYLYRIRLVCFRSSRLQQTTTGKKNSRKKSVAEMFVDLTQQKFNFGFEFLFAVLSPYIINHFCFELYRTKTNQTIPISYY